MAGMIGGGGEVERVLVHDGVPNKGQKMRRKRAKGQIFLRHFYADGNDPVKRERTV